MFSVKTTIATFGLLSALASASHTGKDRRELTYRLRQLYAREVYDINTEPNAPACAGDYDFFNANTGACECGPGRVLVSEGLCAVANGGGEFRTVSLTEPQPLAVPITWSDPVTGPGDVLNAAQCGGVCSEDSACVGYYLAPAPAGETASCWLLGGSNVYGSPEGTGLPFSPNEMSRMAKRAEGQTGAIGAAGGVLGIAQAAQPNNNLVGCNSDLGDVAAEDLSGCVCGPGRVKNADGQCAYPASQGARMNRRVKRDSFEGVPW